MEAVDFLEGRLLVHLVGQRVDRLQQRAPLLESLVGQPAGHREALHAEVLVVRVAVRGEGLVLGAQESRVGEPGQRRGQRDVRRQPALVAGVVALLQRRHGAHGDRIDALVLIGTKNAEDYFSENQSKIDELKNKAVENGLITEDWQLPEITSSP